MPVEVVDALDAECRAFSRALASIAASEFDRVTNCPPWTLKELVAHVLGSTCFKVKDLRPATEGAPVIEAADYYRRPERDERSYRTANVDRWSLFAAGFGSGQEVVATFDGAWPKTVDALRAERVSTLVGMTWPASMALGDYVATRVIGVAAHGIDVAITLGLERWTTAEALEVTTPVLISLLGAELPKSIGWTDQDLLEIGTGRRQLADDDASVLGELARAFPLLS